MGPTTIFVVLSFCCQRASSVRSTDGVTVVGQLRLLPHTLWVSLVQLGVQRLLEYGLPSA